MQLYVPGEDELHADVPGGDVVAVQQQAEQPNLALNPVYQPAQANGHVDNVAGDAELGDQQHAGQAQDQLGAYLQLAPDPHVAELSEDAVQHQCEQVADERQGQHVAHREDGLPGDSAVQQQEGALADQGALHQQAGDHHVDLDVRSFFAQEEQNMAEVNRQMLQSFPHNYQLPINVGNDTNLFEPYNEMAQGTNFTQVNGNTGMLPLNVIIPETSISAITSDVTVSTAVLPLPDDRRAEQNQGLLAVAHEVDTQGHKFLIENYNIVQLIAQLNFCLVCGSHIANRTTRPRLKQARVHYLKHFCFQNTFGKGDALLCPFHCYGSRGYLITSSFISHIYTRHLDFLDTIITNWIRLLFNNEAKSGSRHLYYPFCQGCVPLANPDTVPSIKTLRPWYNTTICLTCENRLKLIPRSTRSEQKYAPILERLKRAGLNTTLFRTRIKDFENRHQRV